MNHLSMCGTIEPPSLSTEIFDEVAEKCPIVETGL